MKLILACTPSGGIGYRNKLPWSKIQGDLPRFQRLTKNGTVVMGRNTWNDKAMPKPLPNRTNIVISSQDIPDVITIKNFPKDVSDEINEIWIIGGAKLIETSWDYIDEIYLTRTFAEYTCDTFIDIVKLEREFMCWFKENHTDHSYEIWKRK